MASSSSLDSSSKYSPRWKYDVFLSFRGEDTRKTITGHLYEGLKNRGIITFQDDKRLELGDSIPQELLKSIEESQVSLVIFSKNYATSRWCLNELVKIMECKDKNGQIVIPIFYDVDATEVRNQSDSFAVAFAKHEKKYKDDAEGMQKMRGWRTALTDASNLVGSVVFHGGVESDCIKDIIAKISSICKTSVSYLDKVVGVDTQLKEIESLLEMEIDDVRIVWIWGMGGIGKTTIAKTIFYNTLSSKFKDACFLEDIKANNHRIHSLQNILLSKLVGEKENCVNNKEEGKHLMARRLRSKKVLVVLDDIDHRDQLNYLAGDLDWLGKGSRIIATTRDKHLMGSKDILYEVTTLVEHQAIQLFNQYAFEGEVLDERFVELTLEVVSHAEGLPLALKVWGSFLRNRDINEWISAIKDMRINSEKEIHEKLKISYDGLGTTQQDIFLDIACFLRGEQTDYIMEILESCHSGANIGLRVLIDRSLVFIDDYDNIQMHDVIQDMSKYIVELQKDPGERSRLWLAEDFEEVMVDNTGTKAMEAIWVEDVRDLCFTKKAMENMRRLRILHIEGTESHSDSIEYLPNSLRWFDCHEYPWKSLPENFEPNRLVHLNLTESSLRHLWAGRKHFPCLRWLDLNWSKSLMRTPDFMGLPNLEYLNLSYCWSLEEVDGSLGYCGKLIQCNLSGCLWLKRFPCVNVESLEFLGLQGCSSLEKFPEIRGRMKPELKITRNNSGIREIPSSFFQSGTHLTKLDLSFTEQLVALPRGIGMLKSLVELDVSYCSKLESFPEEIGNLENLEKLDASCTLISPPPSFIARLNKLKFLSFSKQKYGVGLEDGVCFVFPSVNDGLRSLERLYLSYCNMKDGGLPEDIGSLSSLKKLYLTGNNFEHLPRSISQLGALQSLELLDCERLKELPSFMGMPNLEYLNLVSCEDLKEVDDSLGYCEKLIQLYLGRCSRLKRFPCVNMESLEFLDLRDCSSLEKFPEIRGKMKPELEIMMTDSGIREISSSFFQSGTHLTKLDLSFTEQLVALPRGIGMLKSLVELDVSCCSKLESLPEEIGNLENLEKLDASCTLISPPPSFIARLNKLKFLSFRKRKSEVGLEDGVCFVFPQVNDGLRSLEDLDLDYCNLIDGGLPEDIGSLSSLKKLSLVGNNFEHLPRSIAQLGALEYLELLDCKRLKELPCFMGMPNLEYLNLGNCDDLEEVDDSLGYCEKLIQLYLGRCSRLKRFPCVNVESLEFINLRDCSSLEKFPEIKGRSKLGLKIKMKDSGIREIPSSFFQSGAHLTKLDLSFMKNLVVVPRGIGMLKSLVVLNVSSCSKLESLPEEIGDLENLEKLDASCTLISPPPSSIARLNKLKFLSFRKRKLEVGLEDGVCFVFPQVNDGLRSLEDLDLDYCNLIDGGLPEDIGSLSSLKKLSLVGNNFEHLPRSIAQLGALEYLELLDCKRLKELPGFMGMPNLEYLNLGNCDDLEEVDDSLGYCRKLIQLYLGCCSRLKRFPCVNVESLEFLNLRDCSSLEKFPEINGRSKLGLKIKMKDSGIREIPSSFFQSGTYLTKLDLSFTKHLVALPGSIGMLKSLVELDVLDCSSLEILPAEIGDLESLEKLDASCTLISRPPSSISRLNKLIFLSFRKHISEVGLEDGVCFVFPSVNDGLRSLERLYLSYCNMKDGGLPEDIGSLSSLKELYLNGNNFENLPRSISQLGALRILDVSDCMKLTQLPEFP
ncbi:TMV resistance protein N-like [Lycium barbarum]|uniref:TMV resistance protein N-like n=1 Tax=Lycium barbarum TaxID=112863 RepID=UPI00293F56D5|nr:TMV resistance protein N-like [Lycium barbarum]